MIRASNGMLNLVEVDRNDHHLDAPPPLLAVPNTVLIVLGDEHPHTSPSSLLQRWLAAHVHDTSPHREARLPAA